jgi:threonyl-tRNA synthetase
MLVLGDKEIENGEVAVRSRKAGDMGTMSVADFCAMAHKEVDDKVIN